MKKILNWFKKRTASKLLIVLFAACTIGFLIVGKWWPALIEFAFFLSWVALDLKNNTIEVQGRTISQLTNEIQLRKGKGLEESLRSKNRIGVLHAEKVYWFNKYLLEFTKVQFCKRKMSCSEYIKRLNNLEEEVRLSKESLFDMKRRFECE